AAPSVAPGHAALGVFLPYTPLHKLLFDAGAPRFLVMTSGNRSDEPIISTLGEAHEKLAGVADLYLVHDRPILHPVDDSVAKEMGEARIVMVRRARGYAPRPLPLKGWSGPDLLAAGAELMSTVTVLRKNLAFTGPHMGDLKNLETESGYRRGVEHLIALLRAEVGHVACDMHPLYRSTAFAEEFAANHSLPLTKIQHHEAHAAACMAENGFTGEGVALTLDGVGYGRDGTIWGGEILAGRPGGFRRAGHLRPVAQPGGDMAALEPWRMAASHLKNALGEGWLTSGIEVFAGKDPKELSLLDSIIQKGLGSPLTSSCGRLFDAAGAIILGLSGKIAYSAQAPMELEGLAARAAEARRYPEGEIGDEDGVLVINPAPLMAALASDTAQGRDRAGMALGFHAALAKTFSRAAIMTCERENLRDVFLTGGCFLNAILTKMVFEELSGAGLRVHLHRSMPPGDGSISFGQAAFLALLKSG
ncbi:carbamoyltransferase HypF, partial [bacterium]